MDNMVTEDTACTRRELETELNNAGISAVVIERSGAVTIGLMDGDDIVSEFAVSSLDDLVNWIAAHPELGC